MAIVDWVILIVLILSVVSAAKAGLILEVFYTGGAGAGIAGGELGLSEADAMDGTVDSFAVVEPGTVVYRDGTGSDDCGRHRGKDRALVGEVGGAGLGGSDGGCGIRSFERVCAGDDRGDGDCRVLAERHVVPAVALRSGVPGDGAASRGCGSCRTGRSDQERCDRPAKGATRVAEAGCMKRIAVKHWNIAPARPGSGKRFL